MSPPEGHPEPIRERAAHEHPLARVLIPVAAATVVNVLILAYSLGETSSKLQDLAEEVSRLRSERDDVPREAIVKMAQNESRIAGLERDFTRMTSQLDRIETKIDRNAERSQK